MALILNKSVTGITSSEIIQTGIIESGITESGITYTETGYIEVIYDELDYIITEYTTGYTNLNYKDEFGNTHENPYLLLPWLLPYYNHILLSELYCLFVCIPVKVYPCTMFSHCASCI
jgi:hypothetical protein